PPPFNTDHFQVCRVFGGELAWTPIIVSTPAAVAVVVMTIAAVELGGLFLAGKFAEIDIGHCALPICCRRTSLKSPYPLLGVKSVTLRRASDHLCLQHLAACCPASSLSTRIVSASIPGRIGKALRLPAEPAAQAGRRWVPRCTMRVATLRTVSMPSPRTIAVVTSSSGQSRITQPPIGPSAFGFSPVIGRRQ